MEQLENIILGESRTLDKKGNLINSNFGYYNSESGTFEKRGLKEHLTDLGIYLETQTEQSQQLRDYYKQLKQMIK